MPCSANILTSHHKSLSPHPHIAMIHSGKDYVLTDRQSYGTLDLSGQDQRSVIGYPRHKQGDQKVRCVAAASSNPPAFDLVLNSVEVR